LPLFSNLYLDTGLEPDDALQIMADDLNFEVDRNRDAEGHRKDSVGPGFLVYAYRPVSPGMVDIVREEFGIDPKVVFNFHEIRSESPDEPHGPHAIVEGVQAVCRALPGDALLLFNGEVVELLKKDGVLYVNSKFGWTDYSIFQQPYVLKEYDHL